MSLFFFFNGNKLQEEEKNSTWRWMNIKNVCAQISRTLRTHVSDNGRNNKNQIHTLDNALSQYFTLLFCWATIKTRLRRNMDKLKPSQKKLRMKGTPLDWIETIWAQMQNTLTQISIREESIRFSLRCIMSIFHALLRSLQLTPFVRIHKYMYRATFSHINTLYIFTWAQKFIMRNTSIEDTSNK